MSTSLRRESAGHGARRDVGVAQMRLTPAARTQTAPTTSGVEDAAAGELRRGAWSHGRRRICMVTETAQATSSSVGRGRRRILRGDGGGTGDELRRGGRSHRLRRGRWTWSPVSRSRRRTPSPATSSDVDRGWERMRLPATRFGFSDQLEYKEYIILLRLRQDAATIGMDDDDA
uniref:Uncharacterized protein n=1 Tax=Oryza glumipatula TaxID=40148 RepID=A0A0D9YJX0_9ORYZ